MKKWLHYWKSLVLILGVVLIGMFLFKCTCTRTEELFLPYKPPFLANESAEVDSLVDQMSINELVGHLFILRTSIADTSEEKLLYSAIRERKIGGVLLEKMSIDRYISSIETLRERYPFPLFIATDQQYLINNQLTLKKPLPQAESYFALPEDSLKLKLRELFTKQLLTLGVNFSIGPTFDEALPLGRIAANRYGKSTVNISPNLKLMEPFRQNRILSIAHQFSAGRLMEFRDTLLIKNLLFPYQKMIDQGVSGFMLDTSVIKLQGQSRFYASNFFKERLDFQGLLVTDLSNHINLVDEGLFAGTDLFIVDNNFQQAYDYVKYEMQSERISIEAIRQKVKRILTAKSWMRKGSSEQNELPSSEITPEVRLPDTIIVNHFNQGNWDYTRRKIYENSIILANNQNDMVPISNIYKRKFHIIEYSNGAPFLEFGRFFSNYAAQIETRRIGVNGAIQLFEPGQNEDVHVVILDNIPLTEEDRVRFVPFLSDLARRSDVILINFGSYDNLRFFQQGLTVIQVNERATMTEGLSAQLLFGSTSARGVLPFDANEFFRSDQGTEIENFRLKQATADEVGIQPEKLYSIEAIALSAIDAGAMPGCQILIAKEGKIIYSKALGHHTYEKQKPVRANDLYDIASITKVAATTLASMKLFETKQLNLRQRVKDYLTLEEKSTIRNIRIRDLLNHNSGLQSNMPVVRYVYTYDTLRRGPFFYKQASETSPIQVANQMYFNKSYADSIWFETQFLDVGRGYRYSDVNFILMQKVVESITQVALDSFLNEEFYGPMGLQQTLYRPLERFDTSKIVPTEIDDRWRQQVVHGYVHDETAALMGGVAGNAGLFTNAEELAIIFQMLLNKGTYGGKQYLNPTTVEFFTKKGHGNHRGLGFDKPYEGSPAVARDASGTSFGHTGFTGTCVWVDPDNDLIYIFLSNRIHPSRANTELLTLRVRQRIQQVIYDALNSYEPDTSIPDLPFDLPD